MLEPTNDGVAAALCPGSGQVPLTVMLQPRRRRGETGLRMIGVCPVCVAWVPLVPNPARLTLAAHHDEGGRPWDPITLIIVLAILGFCVWLVITYIPMPAPIRTAIVVIVVLVIVLYVVRLLLGGATIRVGP